MNHGVIIQPLSETAWIVGDNQSGGTSKIVYEVRNQSGNWQKYLNTPENQNGVYTSTMSCVSFSFNEAVELGANFLIETYPDEFYRRVKQLSVEEQVLFQRFFNHDARLDLSDRALAKLSGTTSKGNSLEKVADFGRVNALPQSVWDFPNKQRDPKFLITDFYSAIPDELVKEYSEVFFKIFKINNEFIPNSKESLIKHLKQSPIQIIVSCCPGWNGSEVGACGNEFEHAILLVGIDEQGRYIVRDSLDAPNDKLLAADYRIGAPMKILTQFNPMPMSNCFLLQKENAKDIVLAIPIDTEEAAISYFKNFGIPYATKENGLPDWDKITKSGTYKLK